MRYLTLVLRLEELNSKLECALAVRLTADLYCTWLSCISHYMFERCCRRIKNSNF
jgi:hypothetical protein